jgi:hypothetical protein
MEVSFLSIQRSSKTDTGTPLGRVKSSAPFPAIISLLTWGMGMKREIFRPMEIRNPLS